MDDRFHRDLLGLLLGKSPCPIRLRDGEARVEIVPCRAGDDALYFVLNHEPAPRTLSLSRPLQDLLNEGGASQDIELPAYGVAILSERMAL
jgi:hypothetical protein